MVIVSSNLVQDTTHNVSPVANNPDKSIPQTRYPAIEHKSLNSDFAGCTMYKYSDSQKFVSITMLQAVV
jgi:hypothetical protein